MNRPSEEAESKQDNERQAKNEASKKLYKNVMQHIPLLSGLTDKDLDRLANGTESKTVPKDGYLMRQGEVGDKFFIIVKGRCEVTRDDGEGGQEVLCILENRDYVGETALINEGEKRNASVRALDKTICLVTNRKTFKDVLGSKGNNKFVDRSKAHKNYRAAVLTAINEGPEDLSGLDTTKDEEKVNFITDAVSYNMRFPKDHEKNVNLEGANLMFRNLDEDQKENVIKKMYRQRVRAGERIIIQGDVAIHGDPKYSKTASNFYVVDSGCFCGIKDDEKLDWTAPPQTCFGELALMYDAPRAITIEATQDSVVWVITRYTFRHAVRATNKANAKRNIEFLRSVPGINMLLSAELSLLDTALEERTYPKGKVIMKQGDRGDRFYIVKKGKVTGQSKKEDGTVIDINLKAGDFFGELALMSDDSITKDDEKCGDKRAATLKAKSKLTTLELTKQDFEILLGPLKELLADKRRTQGKNREVGGGVDKLERPCPFKKLKQLHYLGRGAFGYVTMAEDPEGNTYALKAVKKCQIVETGQQTHIVSEKTIMAQMRNPFLVNLICTYQDNLRVYFLLELCQGGELFTILRQRRYFDEPTSQFYAACVVEGFDYMHSMDIIYRDLKPENLVMSKNGYLQITDFGFAKVVPNKTYTLCGTPDYLAPEIVTGQGHGKAVDWWTFGVLIYEMLASFPPFFDDDPIQTYRKIIKGRIKYPRYFSPEGKDIVGSLLKLKPTRRLGVIKGGPANIRKHAWFKNFDWKRFQCQNMEAPIKPTIKDKRDRSNFNRKLEKDDDAQPISEKDAEWCKEF